MTDAVKVGEAFQKVSKEGFDAAVHSYAELNKGLQALATGSPRTRRGHLRTRPALGSN
jgi:hypothetical protein